MSKAKPYQRNLPVPFFSQRENQYMWEIYDGEGNLTGKKKSVAWCSCNVTSLCMIMHYFGLSEDTPDDMMAKIHSFAATPDSGDKFRDGIRRDIRSANEDFLLSGYNLERVLRGIYNVPDKYKIVRTEGTKKLDYLHDEIERGYPIWFSYGATTGGYKGHIAAVRGFTEENDVIINDPWGDVATPFGDLSRSNTGTYYSREINGNDKYYGLGNGDNCVLREKEFKNIIKDKEKLNQTLVIRYPHIWSFPFRETVINNGNSAEKIIRFSDYSVEAEKEKAFREGQIKKMLGMEIIDNAGYPISTNRQWHDGIHIIGAGKPVYAAGPGRLVAARIRRDNKTPQSGSSNFVLVRHQVTIDGKKREFTAKYGVSARNGR